MELLTQRLRVRPFAPGDWDAFLDYFTDPEIWRMMGFPLDMSVEEQRADFDWLLENTGKTLAVALREDGRVVGHIVAGEPNPPVLEHPRWGKRRGKSLSFALHRDLRRQGLMKEALAAVLNRLFDGDPALEYVNGGWFSFNAASGALHRSLGFTPDFTHRIQRNGEDITVVEGFVTRSSWEKRKEAPVFRKMRRFKQQLSDAECLEVLETQPRGVLAVLGDEDYPYAVPLNFLYRDGKLYFHGAREGHKLDAIRRHDKVSFCVLDGGYRREGEWALNIRSVIVFGRIRPMAKDEPEIEELLRALGNKYNPDPADVERELRGALGRVQMLELTVERMTGKLVNES